MDTRKRRGVRASREKLEKALADAGLKTQTALALRIAEIENLENIPTDMVSRVFREISVSRSSIQRIAKALDVDAAKLYLDVIEESSSKVRQQEPLSSKDSFYVPEKTNIFGFKSFPLVFLPLVICLVSIFFLVDFGARAQKETTSVFKKKIGTVSLLFVVDETFSPYKSLIMQSFREVKTSFISRQQLHHANINFNDKLNIINKYQADAVIDVSSIEHGRTLMLEATISVDKSEILFLREFAHKDWLKEQPQLFFKPLVSAIRGIINNSLDKTLPRGNVNYKALEYFVEATSLMQISNSPLHIKAAQSRFLIASQLSPDFAEAHAGICRTYVMESWTGEEKYLLEQASTACSSALSLNGDSTYVINSRAFLLASIGRAEEAISLLNEHQSLSNDPEWLYMMAYAQVEYSRTVPKSAKEILQKALDQANSALDAVSSYWQAHNLIGQIYFAQGNVDSALNSMEKAAEYTTNELLLSNIAVLNVCRANFDKAESFLTRAMSFAPDSYLPHEQFALLERFRGNYENALQYQKTAINSVNEVSIHGQWASLAELYLLLNQTKEAIDAFNNAQQVVSRYELRGIAGKADSLAKLYYEYKIKHLKNPTVTLTSEELEVVLEYAKDSANLSSSSKLLLANLLLEHNEKLLAIQLIEEAKSVCPSFGYLEWVKNAT